MDFLKSVGGRVVGGVVTLMVIIGAITWFRASDASKDALLSGAGSAAMATGKVLGWLAVVAILPWALFFVIGRVARLNSNAAGAAFVVLLTAGEATLLAWMFDWAVRGATGWVFFGAATLIAGVYNLFACDWIAEKVEG